MRVAVIGGGMAGLACGEALQERGHTIAVFDKGRRPGGRMSTRPLPTPLGEADFDYGAPCIAARDPAFRARIERWRESGVVAPWAAAAGLAAGEDRFVGMPGMSAPLVDLAGRMMAGRMEVRWSTHVAALGRGAGGWRLRGRGLAGEGFEAGGFDAVAVAIPAEQAGPLVEAHDPALSARAAAAPSRACWSVLAAFAEPLPVAADMVETRGAVACAVRNSAKPGRSGPEAWVLHADAAWSRERLEHERETITAMLLAEFAEAVGIALPEPLAAAAHRWRYAGAQGRQRDHDRRPAAREAASFLWNGDLRLGLCGDWLAAPEVEAAWLSGTALGQVIAEQAVERRAIDG